VNSRQGEFRRARVDFELAVVAGESFGVVNDCQAMGDAMPAPSPTFGISSSLAVWLEGALRRRSGIASRAAVYERFARRANAGARAAGAGDCNCERRRANASGSRPRIPKTIANRASLPPC